MRTAVAAALAALLTLAVLAPSPAAADAPHVLPDGFHDVALAAGLADPTAVRFAGDGRMYVAEKWGPVLVFDEPQDPTPTEVINLEQEVNSYWDRGLLGMALDPDLGANGGHLYLLYSRDAALGQSPPQWHDDCPGPQQANGCPISARLVRVTVGANGKAIGAPTVLVDQQWCAQFPSHSIGTVLYGADGYLYAGAGDGASFNTADWGQIGTNPCGDPTNEGGALRAQDYRLGNDPVGYDGAILRVDPQTGASRSIVAYGLRNPFRFTFRAGDLWLGDVGWNTWEEIDHFTPGAPVENFGWPCFEGTGRSVNAYSSLAACTSLAAADVTPPFFTYKHGVSVVAGDNCDPNQGSAVSGIGFYSGSAYPAAYRGALFFTDVSRNCMWLMRAGAGGLPDPATTAVFARGTPAGHGGPVDVETAPNGDIVYAYLGEGGGQIRQVRYSPVSAQLSASATYGLLPLNVTFDTAGSTGDGRTYAWDFDDGTGFHAGAASVTHQFTAARAYTVRVRVTDQYGDQAVASVIVRAGDEPPQNLQIGQKLPAGGWSVGDALHFEGSADDPDGDPLDYTWKLTIRHCMPGGGCHSHDVSTAMGTKADFVAPDHPYPSLLWITFTARDALGLAAEKRIELAPRTVQLTVRATPAPMTVRLDGAAASAATQTVIAGGLATVSTTSPQNADGQTYRFMGWSDGDTSLTRTFSVRGDTSLTARFVAPPGARTAPAITGRARTHHTLTASTGTWLGNELAYGYQWSRCADTCTAISGATARTYRPNTTDIGKRLSFRVTARNDLGAASQDSGRTAIVVEGVPPEIELAAGRRLRLDNGRLRLRVECPRERCALAARAELMIEGRKPQKTQTVERTLGAGRRRTATIKLSGKLRRAVTRALRRDRAVTARFTVTATDAAGNRSTRHKTVHLR
jgi:glucose/arabinose dehydrogenase